MVLRVKLRPEPRSQLSPVAPQAACQESFMNSVDFPVGRGIELWARLVCVFLETQSHYVATLALNS